MLYASCNECGAKSPGLWQEKKPEPNDQSWKDAADEWNHRPGEPDPENCGKAYREHYPEGLPVCGKCREESTLAHDKACALLAEARAEIENLQWRVSNEKAKAEAALELNGKALELVNEARAEIERLKGVIISQITPEAVVLSIYSTSTEPAKDERDKLIEQMREALEIALDCVKEIHGEESRDYTEIKAALAAERGGRMSKTPRTDE